MKKLIKDNIKLPATEAKLIADSGLFSYIDSDFKSWDIKDAEAQEMKLAVYQLTQNSTFQQFYDSLNNKLDKFVVTQGQIIEFVKRHRNLLSENLTFFLVKSSDKFFVVRVNVRGAELGVRVSHLGDDRVWYAGFLPRFVLPQLPETKKLKPESLTPSILESLKIEFNGKNYRLVEVE